MAQHFNNSNYDKPKPKTKTETEEARFDAELKGQFSESYSGFFKDLQSTDNYNLHIEKLKSFMQSLLGRSENITTSQLRNIFSVAKRAKKKEDLFFMRPKLAYAYGRADKDELKKLLFFLDKQIKSVKEDLDVKKFQELFEAIVAYHKYYGGKD